MRYVRGWITAAVLAGLAGCAHPAVQREGDAPQRARRTAAAPGGVDCRTVQFVIGTATRCGDDGLDVSISGE